MKRLIAAFLLGLALAGPASAGPPDTAASNTCWR